MSSQPVVVQSALQISHVTADAAPGKMHEVFGRPVFAVGHHCFGLEAGVGFTFLAERGQSLAFVDDAGRGLIPSL